MFDANSYNPSSVFEVIYGNPESKDTVENIANGSFPIPWFGKTGILFYGVAGTGKTTLAKMMPEVIEKAKTGQGLVMPETFIACQQGFNGPQVLSLIEKHMNTSSLNQSKFTYFILDEVDNLTALAQQSLKSALNTPRGVFVMTTNHVSKLDKGFLNRCILIEMNAASTAQLLPLATKIAKDLKPELTTQEVIKAIEGCNGSVRNLAANVLFEVLRKRKALATLAANDEVIEAA